MGGGRRRTSTESATNAWFIEALVLKTYGYLLPPHTAMIQRFVNELEACRSSRVAWPLAEQHTTKPRHHGSPHTQNIIHAPERGTEHEKTRGACRTEKTLSR